MNRLFVSFLFIFILKFNFGYSQYTEIINSNRPGSSSGAFSVGKNILQLENGFYYTNEEHQLLNYKVKGFGADFKIRYGFLLDKLELIIDGIYQVDNFSDNRYSPSNSFDRKNFKKFKIGAKYLIYDPKKGEVEKPNVYSYFADKKFKWKNLIPAISAYVGMNLDSRNNPYTNTNVSGINPSAAIFTQSNITYRSVITTNLILERIGSSQNDFEYIVSLTHAFSESMIGFVETHGIKSDFYAENKMNLGVAFLFTDNFQIDSGVSVNFKDTPQIFNVGLGLSYRLNLNAIK